MAGAVAGHRTGVLEPGLTIAALSFGLALAGFAVASALAAFLVIWRDGREGGASALLGLLVAAAVLVYPGILFARLFTLPAVADVSTDTANAPQFEALAQPLNPRRVSDGPAQADARTISRLADADIVFTALIELVEDRGWEIVRIDPPETAIVQPLVNGLPAGADIAPESPGGNPPDAGNGAAPVAIVEPLPAAGFIEAIAATPVVGFPEDVVIRVQSSPAGTLVDMRSASRVFAHDFGSNSRRIAELLRALDDLLSPSGPE